MNEFGGENPAGEKLSGHFSQEDLVDIGFHPETDFDVPPEELDEDVYGAIDRKMEGKHLDLMAENEAERVRSQERIAALERAADTKLADPYSKDKHQIPILELAKRYFDGRAFPNDRWITLLRSFDSRFRTNTELETLSEAVQQEYLAEEVKEAEQAYTEARQESDSYFDAHQDNEIGAIKTEEERLVRITASKEEKLRELLNFKSKLSGLLRDLAAARSDD